MAEPVGLTFLGGLGEIGAPDSLGAIRHMDAEFGRSLSRQSAGIGGGSLQVIAMSDHGQISLAGGKLLACRLELTGE